MAAARAQLCFRPAGTVRPAGLYLGAPGAEEALSWQQPEEYALAPRLQEKLRAYGGRAALEARDLPETPIARAARWQRAYREAVALGHAGLYERAGGRLQEILAEHPRYRDAARLHTDFQSRQREQEKRTAARFAGWRERALEAARRGDRDLSTWVVGEARELAPVAAAQLQEEVAALLAAAKEAAR